MFKGHWNTFGNVLRSSEIFGSGWDVFRNDVMTRQKSHAFDSEKVGGYMIVHVAYEIITYFQK